MWTGLMLHWQAEGTQDRPSSDAAMTLIVVWFDLLNDAASTGADGSGTRNSMANH